MCLYSDTVQQLNPIVNREKRIISIDGGCGVKKEAQLNLLIIPDINCDIDEIFYKSYDEFPTIMALTPQEASSDSIHIYWMDCEIKIIERGKEFTYIEHIKTGRKLYIPNTYIRNDTEACDYTDYVLPIEKGDILALIEKNSKGCIVKKNGVIGWYFGEYECID